MTVLTLLLGNLFPQHSSVRDSHVQMALRLVSSSHRYMDNRNGWTTVYETDPVSRKSKGELRFLFRSL